MNLISCLEVCILVYMLPILMSNYQMRKYIEKINSKNKMFYWWRGAAFFWWIHSVKCVYGRHCYVNLGSIGIKWILNVYKFHRNRLFSNLDLEQVRSQSRKRWKISREMEKWWLTFFRPNFDKCGKKLGRFCKPFDFSWAENNGCRSLAKGKATSNKPPCFKRKLTGPDPIKVLVQNCKLQQKVK